MKMNRRQLLASCVVMMAVGASALSGCGKNSGDEYIGSWEEKAQKATIVQIERNGDGFLMKTTSTKRNGQKSSGSVAATLKDGVLNYPNGPVTGTVTYVKKDDEILVSTFAGNFAFTRVK